MTAGRTAGSAAVCKDVARLRRRRRAYAPTSNTASHDNHEKINSWVSFFSHDEYGAPLDGPSGRRNSAISFRSFRFLFIFLEFFWILRSKRLKLTPKSGIFRKLPFKVAH